MMRTPSPRHPWNLILLSWAIWAAGARASAQTPAGLSIQFNAGQVQIAVTGAVGTVRQIQWTDDLSNPSRWFHLGHCALSHSPFSLSDSPSSFSTARFYRAVATPSTNLAWIPPGTFTMGSPTNEVDRLETEGPQTVVTISRGFWMGKYEVTQAEYEAVMMNGYDPSFFQGDPSRPVERVSWNDATDYCGRLTRQELAAGRIPADSVYRLPTEAEWEYACRAGTATRFSLGDDPGYLNLPDYAWFEDSGFTSTPPDGGWMEIFHGRYYTTHPVGQKLPNPYGLYDMYGNVWEWCQGWLSERLPGGMVIDPQSPETGSIRLIRGGSFLVPGGNCRSACRGGTTGNDPSAGLPFIGFRVVLAPTQP